MARRRTLLLITLLALTFSASAQDAASPENVAVEQPVGNPGKFGVTLTCSARLPTAVVGCFLERPVLVLGPVEVAIGVDAQAAFSDAARSHLAPYAVLAYYGADLSAWVELRLPELNGLQPLGDPDWLRLGVSWRL